MMVKVDPASADPPRYRIIVVEPPDGVGEIEYFPEPDMGINNRGEIVSTLRVDDAHHPFVWLPAVNANYGAPPGMSPGTHSLPIDPNGQDFVARKVNVNGIAVGRGLLPDGTSVYKWDLNTGGHGAIPIFVSPHKEEASDINDAVPPVIVGFAWISPFPILENRGFRLVLGGSPEALDTVLPSHYQGFAAAVSDAGFVVGRSYGDLGQYQCGVDQDVFRAASWAAVTTEADNLATLGTSQAEAFTVALGVNNASPSMIVGYGDDPDDPTLPCRQRALFWESATVEPIALPYLTNGSGTPIVDTAMKALAIADLFPADEIRVVGTSDLMLAAVLWRRVNGVWEAIDLNNVSDCGGDEWANLSHAADINDCGWIVGHGTLTDGSPRAFILVPVDSCPGDLTGTAVIYPDGKVNVNDLLYVISKWGTSDCVADVTGDAAVNVNDLLAVINHWGACPCFPSQPPVASFSQTLTAAGLTQAKWNQHVHVMTTGSVAQQLNYNCWMQRYLSGCVTCPACPGRDPFAN